jgi:beta-phosphoglucomutase-like phosphatase (HAD superfamily)
LDAIQAVMFEPVGCLAEFRSAEFERAARELFASTEVLTADGAAPNASLDYWHLLTLMDQSRGTVDAQKLLLLEERELAAVASAELYEDVVPSLEKLRAAGVSAWLVSSLSRRAVGRFIERFALAELFTGVVARDEAQGVMGAPLRLAIEQAGLDPQRVMSLVDTAAALAISKRAGVNAVLMINDYDEGRALSEQNPAGGVVSLAELAEALVLIEQRSRLRSAARMPQKPFELFEPS